ncbi:hypothetical protein [Oribacterium sp. NK2B42]|uniref:hypothetical protein n=1 Tax=Oribacterium sp. NK2B42 TaxID=689781 RepID=UPI0003FFF1FE|nr:hypothetical protein [Oribacterium sp. NK2B42]
MVKKVFSGSDLYKMAMAEDMVQHAEDGYPESWWELPIGEEIEEDYDKLSKEEQRELEKRMKEFVPTVSEAFKAVEDLRQTEFDTEEEFLEEHDRIIEEIGAAVDKEFEDFLIDDDE